MVGAQAPQALTQWVERVRPRATPGLNSTVQDILRLTGRSDSSTADLVHAILRDPALTARLLRAANAFATNPGGREISTVSRATVLLGFNGVRRIALSLSLMDDCLRGPMRTHMARELARCFHAATQARSLAQLVRDPEPEEIYIAALMHSLGSIVFWSSGDRATVELDQALRAGSTMPDREVEQVVLGFGLAQLTRRLNQEWQISRLLDDVLSGPAAADRRGWCVRTGREIAIAAEGGWDSTVVERLVLRLAGELKTEARALRQRLRENAVVARGIAELYEAAQVGSLIPQPR